jgi:hypothetical protein
MLLGNHDYYGNPHLQLDIPNLDSRWVMPHYYYDFVIQSKSGVKAHFVVMDSNSSEYTKSSWDKQVRWLSRTLSKTINQVHWTILMCHHPWKSTGWHGNSEGRLKQLFDRLVEKYPIDFILTGHDHDMQVINVNGKTTQVVVGTGAVVRSHSPRMAYPNTLLFYAENLGIGKLSLFKQVAHLSLIGIDSKEPIYKKTIKPKSTLYNSLSNQSNRKKSLH